MDGVFNAYQKTEGRRELRTTLPALMGWLKRPGVHRALAILGGGVLAALCSRWAVTWLKPLCVVFGRLAEILLPG